jgi:ribosomal protein S18 acetylase RimI-like enzyme
VSLHLRPARPADLPFLLSLAPRLAEFGVPPWRTRAQVVDAERRALTRTLEAGSADAPILVAEETDGTRLGFVYLETHTDFFTGRSHAHISVLAVADAAEGRGVGRALVEAAEDWARDRGHPFISLNVFTQNVHARGVYERLGYGPETLRYVKPLKENAAS